MSKRTTDDPAQIAILREAKANNESLKAVCQAHRWSYDAVRGVARRNDLLPWPRYFPKAEALSRQVADLAAQGARVGEIASKLEISTGLASYHLGTLGLRRPRRDQGFINRAVCAWREGATRAEIEAMGMRWKALQAHVLRKGITRPKALVQAARATSRRATLESLRAQREREKAVRAEALALIREEARRNKAITRAAERAAIADTKRSAKLEARARATVEPAAAETERATARARRGVTTE